MTAMHACMCVFVGSLIYIPYIYLFNLTLCDTNDLLLQVEKISAIKITCVGMGAANSNETRQEWRCLNSGR